VDVQAERLEVIVVGWGKEFESWLIDRRIIYGSPERPSTWEELDKFLAKEYKHESGLSLPAFSSHGLACVCIDSGYSTDAVYTYVKSRQRRRFFATKGESGNKRPFVIEVKYEKKYQARFARLGVDAIKARIYDRLTLTREPDQPYPGGFMHFHDRTNRDFFDQLTAEKRVIIKTPSGYPQLQWVLKPNRRNEVLDCYVLNVAAITILGPDFDALKDRLKESAQELEMAAASKSGRPAQSQRKPEPPPPPQPPRRRGNFSSSW
jgi:phage terminase large subunit GpA-like protein